MPTFGFSAFLKLLSMNPRPQKREVRMRLVPSEGGYDFHRSLRLKSGRLIFGGESLESLIDEAVDFANPAERRSLEAGLRQLDDWRAGLRAAAFQIPPALYTSPAGEFRISFVPDFGCVLGTQTVAVHLWNTSSVPLSQRMTYAALALAHTAYDGDIVPDDVAVLSLPENRLYRLSDVPDQSRLAAIVAANLDRLFDSVRGEIAGTGLPPEGPPARLDEY